MCRRSAWRWRASGRAADGGDRLGGPGGRLSFAFLEAAPFRRWAVRSTRTYRQVSQDTGVPLETLGAVLESMGFARMGPDEPMREDELEVVPLLQLGLSSGTFDLAWLTRLGRAHADGLRLLATAWTEAYQARFEGLALESGSDQQTAWSWPPSWAATSCRWGTPRCWASTAGNKSSCGPSSWSSASRTSSRLRLPDTQRRHLHIYAPRLRRRLLVFALVHRRLRGELHRHGVGRTLVPDRHAAKDPAREPIPVHQWMSVVREAIIASPSWAGTRTSVGSATGSRRTSIPRSAGLKNMPIVTTT
jgi:hypothetical protein